MSTFTKFAPESKPLKREKKALTGDTPIVKAALAKLRAASEAVYSAWDVSLYEAERGNRVQASIANIEKAVGILNEAKAELQKLAEQTGA